MKRFTNIGGALIIAITLSFLFVYLGLMLALGSVYGVLTIIFWFVFPPLIFIISIYFGYKNSKLENPSKVFSWAVRICSLILLAFLIWWTNFFVKNIVLQDQRVESNQNVPLIPAGNMVK